jgi:hypothetical protein
MGSGNRCRSMKTISTKKGFIAMISEQGEKGIGC